MSVVDGLSELRVLFGHQSVGANILAGVSDLLRAEGSQWPMVELNDPSQAPEGGFLGHARVGRNGDPRSKTAHFCELVAGPLGERLDVAFHKNCYVDVTAGTDVAALFSDYREAMSKLAALRPRVRLVHVTVPLVRVRTGVVALAQAALGRRSPRVEGNARREAFNDLLRSEYGGRGTLFDLADLESPTVASVPGRAPRSLRAEYTEDGGHVNEAGRRWVAGELMRFLAGHAKRPF